MEPVTQKEIHKAFKYHKELLSKYDNPCNRSRKMVLFYTVECGLKALYMNENKLWHTSKSNNLKESVLDFQHDLVELMKQINMHVKMPNKARYEGGNVKKRNPIEYHELHQAWRYGKKLKLQDEAECIEWLKRILKELELKLL